ncbi:MAG TPA: DUF3592 domain-containing protein [Candidatus Saccharimonadia bacterium]|nr:DUF3592 domain-containing protein [Candidatus Saccharimonadia bacterium]
MSTPSPATPQQLSAGCLSMVMIFGLVTGAGIAFGGMALLWQVPSAWKEMRDVWTETSGTVLKSRVRSREVRTGNQPQNYRQGSLYYVELEYHYVADDARFMGVSSAARQPAQDGNLEEATTVAASYKPGDVIPVFYNPQDITGSRLDAAGPNGLFWVGLFGGPLLIFSGLGLASWSWSDWKAKRNTAARSS